MRTHRNHVPAPTLRKSTRLKQEGNLKKCSNYADEIHWVLRMVQGPVISIVYCETPRVTTPLSLLNRSLNTKALAFFHGFATLSDLNSHRRITNALIRSGEAPAVGWSRQMLYSGFITLPRSVVRWQTGFAARITRTLSRLRTHE